MKRSIGFTGALVVGVVMALTGCGKAEEAPASSGGAASAAATPPATAAPQATAPRATATAVATSTVGALPSNEVDSGAIRSCCSELRREAGKRPTEKAKYESAAATCDGNVDNVRKGTASRASALSSIRAAFKGGSLPAACN